MDKEEIEKRLSHLEALHIKSNPHMALTDEDFLLGLDRKVEENEIIEAVTFIDIWKRLEVLDEHLQGVTKYYTTLKENVTQLQSSKSRVLKEEYKIED